VGEEDRKLVNTGGTARRRTRPRTQSVAGAEDQLHVFKDHELGLRWKMGKRMK